MTAPEVHGGIWEDGTGPCVTENSLNNVNAVSADEVKTVRREIEKNKKWKKRHGQRNQPFKILILFIK